MSEEEENNGLLPSKKNNPKAEVGNQAVFEPNYPYSGARRLAAYRVRSTTTRYPTIRVDTKS